MRPEPFTALLVTLVFACAVAFARSESSAALALATGLIPLAATGHHAGLLTAAPLLAIGPQLISWIRRNPAAATALVTAAFALLLLLAFLGADVGQRSLEAQTLRSYGVPDAWFDELRRYGRLSDFHGGPPLRRGAVALMGLAVLAFLVRRTRTSRGDLLDLPARTLIIGLILLIAVPSKWPWHFGALMGIAAIAVATETHRIRSDDHRPRSWQARWLLAVASITVAIAWSWGPRELWTLLDTNTVDWTPDSAISFSTVAAALPVLLLFVLMAALRLRRRPSSDAPWRVASLAAPILVVPILVFTVAVLAADAARLGVDAGKTKRGIPSRRCGLRVGRHSLDSAAEFDETAARNDKRAHAGPQIRLGTAHTSATPRAVPAPPAGTWIGQLSVVQHGHSRATRTVPRWLSERWRQARARMGQAPTHPRRSPW